MDQEQVITLKCIDGELYAFRNDLERCAYFAGKFRMNPDVTVINLVNFDCSEIKPVLRYIINNGELPPPDSWYKFQSVFDYFGYNIPYKINPVSTCYNLRDGDVTKIFKVNGYVKSVKLHTSYNTQDIDISLIICGEEHKLTVKEIPGAYYNLEVQIPDCFLACEINSIGITMSICVNGVINIISYSRI